MAALSNGYLSRKDLHHRTAPERSGCIKGGVAEEAHAWGTLGAWDSAGSGMEMTTFWRSKAAVASYSMLTYDSPPETLGQQLMDSGTMLSSRVCASRKPCSYDQSLVPGTG